MKLAMKSFSELHSHTSYSTNHLYHVQMLSNRVANTLLDQYSS